MANRTNSAATAFAATKWAATKWAATACAAAMAWVVVGCDNGGASDAPVPPPPDQPAMVSPPTSVPAPLIPAVGPSAPATQPTAPDPVAAAPSYLFLKEVPDPRKSQAAGGGAAADDANDFGKSFEFPRARLRLTGKGGHNVVALLYSDDPKEALKGNWAGDRYYFRMPLQITDRRQIDGTQYRMVAELDGTEESSNGVFLKGDQDHLEPVDLWVIFETQGPRTVASIGGLFKMTDADKPDAEPRWFQGKGIVQATAE